MGRLKSPWIAAAALGAVVFALHWPLLRRPYFEASELYYLLANPSAWDWRNFPALFSGDYERRFSGGFYHPLAIALYMACRGLLGADPVWFRLLQLLLVGAAATLIYTLERGRLGRWAWAAALLYACHPLHGELNMLGVRDQLLVVIFLAGLWARRRPRGWSSTLLTTGLFALALLSKETGLLFPLIMLGDDWAGGRGKPPTRDFVAAGLLLAAYGVFRPGHEAAAPGGYWGYADQETLALMARRLAEFWSRTIGAAALTPSIGWSAASAAALGFSLRRAPNLACAYALWLLPLLLGAGFVPFKPLSELLARTGGEAHRLLLPAVGYCLLLAAGLREAFRTSGRARWSALIPAALSAVLLLGAGLGVGRDRADLDLAGNAPRQALEDPCASIALLHAAAPWDQDSRRQRTLASGDFQAGCARQRKGRPAEALALFERALRLDPALAWAYRERAIILWLAGKKTPAAASYTLYRRAVQKWPYFERAQCRYGPEPPDAALQDWLAQAERLHNEGIALFLSGDHAGAASRLEAAAKLGAGRGDIQLSLAVALDALGQSRRALAAYDKAVDAEEEIERLFSLPSDRAAPQSILGSALSSRAELRRKLGLRPEVP